jgi:hypothetical protein
MPAEQRTLTSGVLSKMGGRGVGDDPENTINDRPRQRLLCRKAKGKLPQTTLAASLLLRVPFGEASRKSARPV